jgi:hypothetical protein
VARKKASPAKPKRRGAKPAATTELTVEDGEARQAKQPMSLESALIIVTLIALIAAFVMINIEMRSSFGEGWPV